MPYLVIHTYNGNEWFSVMPGTKLSDVKSREEHLGKYEYIEITDEQAALTLEALRDWYKQRTTIDRRPVKMKRSDLLDLLVKIIEQSHHEGERENAKALYLRYSGKPYVGKSK